jgi:hypothetical protein
MNSTRSLFIDFCSEITGYSPLELEGTGLVDLYQDLLGKILGRHVSDFYGLAKSLMDASGDREQAARTLLSSSPFWPVVSSLIGLWYLGAWTQLPNEWYAQAGLPIPGPADAGHPHTPSPQAYIEQLSFRTADAHPPGAKPTGFGSWGWKPAV